VPSSFKLTAQAEAAIADIVTYTDANFGEPQTAAYLAGLESSFNLLVSFPGIGTQAFEIEAGLRRYRYQSHYIFYSTDTEVVLIRHIIHVRRNIRRDLFDT
jgi:toxin ParE1/3/4